MVGSSIAGVYAIRNMATGDCYVGVSGCVGLRWKQHQHSLVCGSHTNRLLQAAWDKYGAEAFTMEMLEGFPGWDLLPEMRRAETRWIQTLQPAYNRNSLPTRRSMWRDGLLRGERHETG